MASEAPFTAPPGVTLDMSTSVPVNQPQSQNPTTPSSRLSDAITQAEGAHPKDNNPGNLSLAVAKKFGIPTTGSRKSTGTGATDIAIFPDAETGKMAHSQYLAQFSPDTTFEKLANTYAPGQPEWLDNVTKNLGVDKSDKIGPFQTSSAAPQSYTPPKGVTLDMSTSVPLTSTTDTTGATKTTSGDSSDPGILNKIGEFGKGIVPGAVEGMGETIQHIPFIGKHIISPEAMQAEREYFKPGSPAEKAGQGGGEGLETVLEFVLGDEALKGVAIAGKVGLASKITKIAQDSPYIGALLRHGTHAARMGTVGAVEALAKGATPGEAVKTGVATGVGGELLSTAVEAAPSVVKAVRNNPFRQLIAPAEEVGRAAAAEPGATAVRTIAGATPETPILAGSETVVDKPLTDLATKKTAAYKQIDDNVGFDLKAEKQKLSDTQYAIKQPGADVPKLQAEMDASTQRIAEANAQLEKAKIDPKVADNLNTSWQAGKQFKKGLVNSTSSDGTVNVNQLLNSGKKLRLDPKYGDRLAQFFGKGDVAAGKPLADAYMADLQAAQKAGVHAMHVQKIHQWIGGLIGTAALGEAAYKGVKLLAPAAP